MLQDGETKLSVMAAPPDTPLAVGCSLTCRAGDDSLNPPGMSSHLPTYRILGFLPRIPPEEPKIQDPEASSTVGPHMG